MKTNNTHIAPIYTKIYAKPKKDVSDIKSNTAKLINNKINANRAWIALGVTVINNNNAKNIKIRVIFFIKFNCLILFEETFKKHL